MALQTITWMSAFLCLAQVCSMPMPCQLQGQLVRITHNLLRDMGGHFPLECLQENVFMAFPATAFATSGAPQLSSSGAKAIYETLKNIDTLFGADDLPTKWDQRKLENFQNIVYRQIEESKCMMGSVDTSDYLIRAEGLNTYFGNIATVLKEKIICIFTEFQFCAWEVVRKELLFTLQFILEHNSDSLLWSNRT
ncbi:interferon alpha-B-like [Salvelinus namaycush]|uniref:Interferon alpha-B-like n=1 Tax=Salvelinus namaycush TaxID=8040 RepID=A0A8U0QDM5_SALNM|nr:interferon alpha-B-like [Salvelinus namaycush]